MATYVLFWCPYGLLQATPEQHFLRQYFRNNSGDSMATYVLFWCPYGLLQATPEQHFLTQYVRNHSGKLIKDLVLMVMDRCHPPEIFRLIAGQLLAELQARSQGSQPVGPWGGAARSDAVCQTGRAAPQSLQVRQWRPLSAPGTRPARSPPWPQSLGSLLLSGWPVKARNS